MGYTRRFSDNPSLTAQWPHKKVWLPKMGHWAEYDDLSVEQFVQGYLEILLPTFQTSHRDRQGPYPLSADPDAPRRKLSRTSFSGSPTKPSAKPTKKKPVKEEGGKPCLRHTSWMVPISYTSEPTATSLGLTSSHIKSPHARGRSAIHHELLPMTPSGQPSSLHLHLHLQRFLGFGGFTPHGTSHFPPAQPRGCGYITPPLLPWLTYGSGPPLATRPMAPLPSGTQGYGTFTLPRHLRTTCGSGPMDRPAPGPQPRF